MYVVFKTSEGSIRVSGSLLITILILTFISIMAIIKAADVNSTYSTIVMNVTVSNFLGVNLSSAMQRGILFGSLTVNINNNMAQNDSTGTGNVTEYWIGNDPASTGTINLYHNASDMTRGSVTTDTIKIANVSHESNKTVPDKSSNVNMTNKADGAILMTNAYSSIGNGNCTSVAIGGACYTAYWLDVPASIVGGTYNTTYNYCGNLTVGSTTC
jgi:hypothetical protein